MHAGTNCVNAEDVLRTLKRICEVEGRVGVPVKIVIDGHRPIERYANWAYEEGGVFKIVNVSPALSRELCEAEERLAAKKERARRRKCPWWRWVLEGWRGIWDGKGGCPGF